MLNDYWTRSLPLHPKLVHVPIALCILMPLVAMLIWIGVRRGSFSPRTWLIAAVLQGAMFVAGWASLQTGKQDAAKVEGYASEEALTVHADRGAWFVYVAAANLALYGGTFLLANQRDRQQLVGALAIAGALAGSYAGYLVGDAGGRLVYVASASDAHK